MSQLEPSDVEIPVAPETQNIDSEYIPDATEFNSDYPPELVAEATSSALHSLPGNEEAEKAVLGAILLSPNGFELVEGRLIGDDFQNPSCRYVFEAMEKLNRNEVRIDMLLLAEALKEAGKLETVGGIPGLASLLDAAPTGANVKHYAEIVRDKAVLRRLIGVANKIVEFSVDPAADAQATMDIAEQQIFAVAERVGGREPRQFRYVVTSAAERIIKLYENAQKHGIGEGVVSGIATNYYQLDNMLSGFHEDELIILAARPSMGKTTVALNFLRNITVKNKIPGVFFSLEMGAEMIAQNMLCAECQIDGKKVRSGGLHESDWGIITDGIDTLSAAPLFIDDGNVTLSELRGKVRRLKSRYDIKICMIDYLQLITGSPNAQKRSREQEISEISRGLKALARELHIPVIALAQLNRKVEDRGRSGRPQLSDLRESGAIEQDADVVMLLHRDDYHVRAEGEEEDKDAPAQPIIADGAVELEIIIAKQRNGPTGVVKLGFFKHQMRVENLALDYQTQHAP